MPFDILADENIDPQIIHALKTSGHSVTSVWQHHRGLQDLQILNLAQANRQLILTEDKDFGEYVFSHKILSGGIILLRYQFIDIAKIIEILIDFLNKHGPDLSSKFIVVTPKKIRIRSL